MINSPITLYTLPNCGICKMIKTKLNQKSIPFIEKDFDEIAEKIDSEYAPVLEIQEQELILNSPTSIVDWINKYGE